MVKIVQKKVFILQKKVQMIITEKGIQNKNEKWWGKETNNILEKKTDSSFSIAAIIDD